METIPEALNTNTSGSILVSSLADILGVPCENLRPLVEQGYLRVRVPNESLGCMIVAQPGQRATEWLKTMFRPFELR